jgi:O-antigen/teichoic acid export membrane protein
LTSSDSAFGRTAVKLFELALTHAATFAFPLVFAVVCGRTLGIVDYGLMSFYTAFAGFLGTLIEFGFDWHGTRVVAQSADPAQRHRVLWNITLTKVLLCAATLVVSGPVLWAWRGHDELGLMLGAVAFMVGFSFDAAWYMRALERTRPLLAITACVRLIGVATIVFVVANVATKESALWTYAMVSVATSGATWIYLVRRRLASIARYEPRFAFDLLRRSSAIVLGNLNGSLMMNGGIALLAVIADPAVVGAANLALRVRTAAQAVLLPLQQLGFVRLSATGRSAPRDTVALARRLLVPTLLASVLVAGICMAGAGLISSYVFKADVPLAAMLIMLLALSGPIQAAGSLFGIQSLLAFDQERTYALIQITACVGFLSVLLLLPSQATYGWAIITGESLVMVLSALRLRQVVRSHTG